MARYTNDLVLLIRKLTGLEETEENFELSFQFAESNFKFHRFLSPDGHRLRRTLDRIVEKFEIHSQYLKASSFKTYTNKFLKSSLGDRLPESETHVAILSLLLHLARSPTNAEYIPRDPTPPPPEEEQFDWGRYLQEGIDIDLHHFSQISSDEEEVDEEVTVKHTTFKVPEPSPPASPPPPDEDREASTDWLEQNLVVQYWTLRHNPSDTSTHESSNLRTNWESYLSRSSDLYTSPDSSPISEHHIIREFLWVLSGIKESFIFKWNGDKLVPNADLQVTHLTDACLQSVLSHLVHYGNIIQRLVKFVSMTTDPQLSSSLVNKTYQACGEAVSQYLQTLRTYLTGIERQVCRQESCFTVTSIMESLSETFAELNLLILMITNGVDTVKDSTCEAQKAWCLLREQYRILQECDTSMPHKPGSISVMMSIWLKTLHPYIDIMDNWISHGKLLDPTQEFIIKKNESCGEESEDYWSKAFSIHCPDPVQDTADDGIDTSSQSSNRSHSVPGFLLPVMKEVVLAGKSMYLLEKLGCLKLVTQDAEASSLSLYDTFITSLDEQTGVKHSSQSPLTQQLLTSSLTHSDKKTLSRHQEPRLSVEGSLPAVEGSLSGADGSLPGADGSLPGADGSIPGDDGSLPGTDSSLPGTDGSLLGADGSLPVVEGFHPVEVLLEQSLYRHVISWYQHVASTLLQVFYQQHNLRSQLKMVQSFFLMAAGHTMSRFLTPIFDKVRNDEAWQDVIYLNMILQDALCPEFTDVAEKIHVTVATTTKARSPSHLLDSISLHYMVDWPVSIVLNTASMEVYRQVFTFLLQIKRTKYSLDSLRFTEMHAINSLVSSQSLPPAHPKLHRMCILRLRFLHFVNSLHSHIMTQILQASSLEFDRALTEAQDLSDVLAAHGRFVNSLYQHSLQHERVALVRGIVHKVLDMALEFSSHWQQEAQSLRVSSLEGFEEEFGKCLQFLSSALMPVVKRGLHPHLESLAFALVTSNQALKT